MNVCTVRSKDSMIQRFLFLSFFLFSKSRLHANIKYLCSREIDGRVGDLLAVVGSVLSATDLAKNELGIK